MGLYNYANFALTTVQAVILPFLEQSIAKVVQLIRIEH